MQIGTLQPSVHSEEITIFEATSQLLKTKIKHTTTDGTANAMGDHPAGGSFVIGAQHEGECTVLPEPFDTVKQRQSTGSLSEQKPMDASILTEQNPGIDASVTEKQPSDADSLTEQSLVDVEALTDQKSAEYSLADQKQADRDSSAVQKPATTDSLTGQNPEKADSLTDKTRSDIGRLTEEKPSNLKFLAEQKEANTNSLSGQQTAGDADDKINHLQKEYDVDTNIGDRSVTLSMAQQDTFDTINLNACESGVKNDTCAAHTEHTIVSISDTAVKLNKFSPNATSVVANASEPVVNATDAANSASETNACVSDPAIRNNEAVVTIFKTDHSSVKSNVSVSVKPTSASEPAINFGVKFYNGPTIDGKRIVKVDPSKQHPSTNNQYNVPVKIYDGPDKRKSAALKEEGKTSAASQKQGKTNTTSKKQRNTGAASKEQGKPSPASKEEGKTSAASKEQGKTSASPKEQRQNSATFKKQGTYSAALKEQRYYEIQEHLEAPIYNITVEPGVEVCILEAPESAYIPSIRLRFRKRVYNKLRGYATRNLSKLK